MWDSKSDSTVIEDYGTGHIGVGGGGDVDNHLSLFIGFRNTLEGNSLDDFGLQLLPNLLGNSSSRGEIGGG